MKNHYQTAIDDAAASDFVIAGRIVRDCELALKRRLSEGERRDLLCDNTNWSRERINAAADAMRPLPPPAR